MPIRWAHLACGLSVLAAGGCTADRPDPAPSFDLGPYVHVWSTRGGNLSISEDYSAELGYVYGPCVPADPESPECSEMAKLRLRVDGGRLLGTVVEDTVTRYGEGLLPSGFDGGGVVERVGNTYVIAFHQGRPNVLQLSRTDGQPGGHIYCGDEAAAATGVCA